MLKRMFAWLVEVNVLSDGWKFRKCLPEMLVRNSDLRNCIAADMIVSNHDGLTSCLVGNTWLNRPATVVRDVFPSKEIMLEDVFVW